MISIEDFRRDFPPFADEERYPAYQVEYWFTVADLLLTERWSRTLGHRCPARSMRDIGIELFVAHNLVLELQAEQRAELGGPPGVQTGVITSVGAGGANVSYDTGAGIVTDANHWNLTTYGIRFINLAKMVGSGPIQLGIGHQRGGIPPAFGTRRQDRDEDDRPPRNGPTDGEGWAGPPNWVFPWFPG